MEHNIEEAIKKDPHVIRIFSDDLTHPPDVDIGLWVETQRKSISRSLNNVRNVLGMPYIVDDFNKNHGSRINWRREVSEKYGEKALDYIERNTLKLGFLSEMVGHTGLIPYEEGIYIGSNPSQAESLYNMATTPIKVNYNSLDTPEKIDYVRNARITVYTYIQFLSEQKPIRI